MIECAEAVEPIETSHCRGGWIGGKEEDSGIFLLPEEDEAILISGRGSDEAIEDNPLNELVLKPGGTRGVAVSGMLAMYESSGGPTRSSNPSSSRLITLSICVADWEDELLGLNTWVPQGWVPGIKACILR